MSNQSVTTSHARAKFTSHVGVSVSVDLVWYTDATVWSYQAEPWPPSHPLLFLSPQLTNTDTRKLGSNHKRMCELSCLCVTRTLCANPLEVTLAITEHLLQLPPLAKSPKMPAAGSNETSTRYVL